MPILSDMSIVLWYRVRMYKCLMYSNVKLSMCHTTSADDKVQSTVLSGVS